MIPVLPSVFLEGFSIRSATLLDSTTGLVSNTGRLYGVRSGEIKADVTTWEDVSNNKVIDSWSEVNYLDVSLEFGFLALDTLQGITGESSASSIGEEFVTHEMQLFSDTWGKTAPQSMRLEIPAKDAQGNIATIYYILYSVKFLEFSFMETGYKKNVPVTFSGKAFQSSVDELGVALDRPSYGRLMSVGGY